MKVLAFDMKDFAYKEVADAQDIRLILENGDYFDILQNLGDNSRLTISTANMLNIIPSASNAIRIFRSLPGEDR